MGDPLHHGADSFLTISFTKVFGGGLVEEVLEHPSSNFWIAWEESVKSDLEITL